MHQQTPRHKLYRPEFLELETQAKERHKKRKHRRNPNMEFVPEFNIEVARAPAFRVAEKDYVDELVNRLTQRSRYKSNPRACGHYQRGFEDYESEDEMFTPRTPVTRRRMRGIVDRLSQPKTCSRRHPSPDITEEDYLPNFKI